MSSTSLSACSTTRPASSAVAASNSSGTDGAPWWPRSASSAWTSMALSSMAGARYLTGISPTGGVVAMLRRSAADLAE
jgi:hypothetical protein